MGASNFFDSQASNYLVATAARVSKIEREIARSSDAESLVLLYNSINEAVIEIENAMFKFSEKQKNKNGGCVDG